MGCIPMTREAQGLPLVVRCDTLLGGLRRGSRAVRLGAAAIAIALASVLLAACAGPEGGLLADGTSTTTLKEPVRVSAAKASPVKASPVKASPVKASPGAGAERPAGSS